jgi:hypothetical protein
MIAYKSITALICCVLFSQLVLSQVVRYVGPTGSNLNSGLTETEPYATIQFAIDNSVNGDTVKLLPGNYNQQIAINKSITLCSKFVGFR